MKINDLLDADELAAAIDGGYIRVQTHPTLSLAIYNYTEKAQYEGVWNTATRTCRGLIVNDHTGEIVARPFRKFFNHGQAEASTLDTTGPVRVTDKADGSLGILYPTGPGEWAVATRGSFTSEQARHATEVWRDRYAHLFTPPPGVTVLVEIVYPTNRIVLDYGDLDDLIALGAVDVETGRDETAVLATWPGPAARVFPHRSLADALAAPPRPNAEGLVVHFTDTDERVKVKQADYVALHRILTGFTARRLWERAAVHAVLTEHPDMPVKRLAQSLRLSPEDTRGIIDAGPDWLDTVRATAPEEFLTWITTTTDGLHQQVRDILAHVRMRAAELADVPRRDAAAAIAGDPHRGMIFAALDGKPTTAQAWAAVYPAHERPFYSASEDTA